MKIYEFEKSLNLSNNSVKAVIIPSTNDVALSDTTLSNDMFSLTGILVTTNWNKNDDVFSPSDVWVARMTPNYKPVNINHQGNETTENRIIGVIRDSLPVDEKYCPIASDSGTLPSKYHLAVTCSLWAKYFPDAVTSIKEAINDNAMFLSMECLFDDFGYALKTEGSNEVKLINRNEATSSLTKYLRAYGGDGTCTIGPTKYRIGRWLRSFVFSGVACVTNPANPESIIFSSEKVPTSTLVMSKDENLEKLIEEGVFISSKKVLTLWPM